VVDETNQWLIGLDQRGIAGKSALRRSAGFALAVALLAVIVLLFGAIKLPAFPQFVTFHAGFVLLADGVTAYLLFGQFTYRRQPSYAVLGCAYLFNAAVMLPFLLSYPGALRSEGELLGGSQSAVWVWVCWHFFFPLLALLSFVVEGRYGAQRVAKERVAPILAALIGGTLALVAGVGLIVAVWHEQLPILIVRDATQPLLRTFYTIVVPIALVAATATLIAWRRGRQTRSILHVWLAVALTAFMADIATGLGSHGRYTIGWYCGRIESMIAGSVLLLVFIGEINSLYRRLESTMGDLQRSNEQLAMALRGADLALCDWHLAAGELVFGKGWTPLLGYRADELRPEASTLGALVHPDDATAARDAMISHLKGETPLLEAEIRMRHKRGHWIWVLIRAMVVDRGSGGRATRLAGTGMNITARKSAQLEIGRLSQLNELLLTCAGAGIYGVDPDGRCTLINPAALDMLGLQREDVIGKTAHEVFHHRRKDGSVYPAHECPVHHTLSDGIGRDVEDALVRRNGEVMPVRMSIAPITDGDRLIGAAVVFRDIAQRIAMEIELRHLATTDPLTGVANRRSFMERVDIEQSRMRRFGQPSSVLMLDIDHFKRVNDTFGHAAGDSVLRQLGNLPAQLLRDVDLMGRLGGEEFGILLPGTDVTGALQVAERFRLEIAGTPFQSNSGPIVVTVSIGVTELDPSDAGAEAALARADIALYGAKLNGRNRVETNCPQSDQPSGVSFTVQA
jgi:diguanylate cyclase (GGDEF)-like protein/PAS domain S-box-containing protein